MGGRVREFVCAPLSWVGADGRRVVCSLSTKRASARCPEAPALIASIPCPLPPLQPATARRGIPTQPNPNPQPPSLQPPPWHVLVLLRRCCDGVACGATAVTPTGAHDATRTNLNHVGINPAQGSCEKTAGSGLGPTPSARSRSPEIGSRTRLDPDHPRSHAASPAERRPPRHHPRRSRRAPSP